MPRNLAAQPRNASAPKDLAHGATDGGVSMNPKDPRPLAALGHARMYAQAVEPAARRLEAIGIRPIVIKEDFAVLELRGGTHIVLRQSEDEEALKAPFDLMYDDLDGARDLLKFAGFQVTEIEPGRIHDSFWASAPEGFRIQINSSHAEGRPI